MSRSKRTSYLSLETDAEYRIRLALVTPAAAYGVRVRVNSSGRLGTIAGRLARFTPAAANGVCILGNSSGRLGTMITLNKDAKDVFVVVLDPNDFNKLNRLSTQCSLEREEFSCLPLDVASLDSESLDRIGTMCGVQRRLITRDA